MPRESTPLVRKSGFLEAEKFYVLAYEGDVTEKKILRIFANPQCSIIPAR